MPSPTSIDTPGDLAWSEWLLNEERRRATLLLFVLIPGGAAYFVSDLRFDGVGLWTYGLLRGLYLTLMIMALVALRRRWAADRTRKLISAATLALGIFLLIRYSAGDGHGGAGGDLAADVLTILAVFFLPQNMLVQIVTALLIITGSAIDFAYWKQYPPDALIQALITLGLSLAIGIAGARTLREGLRERWVSQCELQELRALIPICAWCKNIRTDDGAWEQIETYLARHTDAELTHAVCPQCLDDITSAPHAESASPGPPAHFPRSRAPAGEPG